MQGGGNIFLIIRCRFKYQKTAYGGLYKNANWSYALFASANLYVHTMAGREHGKGAQRPFRGKLMRSPYENEKSRGLLRLIMRNHLPVFLFFHLIRGFLSLPSDRGYYLWHDCNAGRCVRLRPLSVTAGTYPQNHHSHSNLGSEFRLRLSSGPLDTGKTRDYFVVGLQPVHDRTKAELEQDAFSYDEA